MVVLSRGWAVLDELRENLRSHGFESWDFATEIEFMDEARRPALGTLAREH